MTSHVGPQSLLSAKQSCQIRLRDWDVHSRQWVGSCWSMWCYLLEKRLPQLRGPARSWSICGFHLRSYSVRRAGWQPPHPAGQPASDTVEDCGGTSGRGSFDANQLTWLRSSSYQPRASEALLCLAHVRHAAPLTASRFSRTWRHRLVRRRVSLLAN